MTLCVILGLNLFLKRAFGFCYDKTLSSSLRKKKAGDRKRETETEHLFGIEHVISVACLVSVFRNYGSYLRFTFRKKTRRDNKRQIGVKSSMEKRWTAQSRLKRNGFCSRGTLIFGRLALESLESLECIWVTSLEKTQRGIRAVIVNRTKMNNACRLKQWQEHLMLKKHREIKYDDEIEEQII